MVRRFIKVLMDYAICVYLISILAVMPFFHREGYAHIGTDKAFFWGTIIESMGKILIPGMLVYLVILTAEQKRILSKTICSDITVTDLFAGGYGLAAVISYFCSEYKEQALWGATGWFMGLVPQLALVLTYFLVSRFWQARPWMLYVTLVSSSLVFLLGYLNRMQIDPLGMGTDKPGFISTIGNINWYCGYLVSVFFAGVALLWQEKGEKRFPLILYVVIGSGTLVTQGSDSGFAALGAVLLVMFVLSAPDGRRMFLFWQEMLLFGMVCVVTYTVRLAAPGALNYSAGCGEWLTTGWRPFFVTFMSFSICIALYISSKRDIYFENMARVCTRICVSVALIMVLLLPIMIAVNTWWPGSLGSLSDQPFFTFSMKWGSGRGATWAAGWRCFTEQGFLHKLVGVGPDAMAAYLYNGGSEGLLSMVKERFGELVLANAHNEWLTVLVNTGLLGLFGYGGMMVTGIWRFLKEAGRQPIVCACGFCLLAYTVNNIFSFQQSMNVATLFAVFGMGEAFLRKAQGKTENADSSTIN